MQMRLIFAISLFLAILFVTSFAHAATYQSIGSSCENPEIVTMTTSQHIFINPHTGFADVPLTQEFLRCPLALKNQ
jgi:hypothetical protein